jgi:signal peptidase I
MPTARRNPWVAGVLSFLMPGLGQLYNGQGKKAVLFTTLIWVAWLVPPYNIVVPFVVIIIAIVGMTLEAVHTAKRHGETSPLKAYNKWYVYISTLGLAAFVFPPSLVGALVKSVYIEGYRMPAASSEPTILSGDLILVNKVLYCINSHPQRGDIVVFKFPEDESKDFIERIIGLPGDTVEIREKQVWINGELLPEPYKRHVDSAILSKQVQPRDNLGITSGR